MILISFLYDPHRLLQQNFLINYLTLQFYYPQPVMIFLGSSTTLLRTQSIFSYEQSLQLHFSIFFLSTTEPFA